MQMMTSKVFTELSSDEQDIAEGGVIDGGCIVFDFPFPFPGGSGPYDPTPLNDPF